MNNIKIVPMNADHLESLERLERICFSRPWSRKMLAEELENQCAAFLVAEDAVTGDVLFATGMTGAVLSGAIFGDHCSPVSDTTVMASIFSGADHIDHVGTQVPYAATVISVIAVLYVIFGFTELSPFILLLIGVVALYFLQIILHKYSMKKYNIDPNYTKYMTEDHKK